MVTSKCSRSRIPQGRQENSPASATSYTDSPTRHSPSNGLVEKTLGCRYDTEYQRSRQDRIKKPRLLKWVPVTSNASNHYDELIAPPTNRQDYVVLSSIDISYMRMGRFNHAISVFRLSIDCWEGWRIKNPLRVAQLTHDQVCRIVT